MSQPRPNQHLGLLFAPGRILATSVLMAGLGNGPLQAQPDRQQLCEKLVYDGGLEIKKEHTCATGNERVLELREQFDQRCPNVFSRSQQDSIIEQALNDANADLQRLGQTRFCSQ